MNELIPDYIFALLIKGLSLNESQELEVQSWRESVEVEKALVWSFYYLNELDKSSEILQKLEVALTIGTDKDKINALVILIYAPKHLLVSKSLKDLVLECQKSHNKSIILNSHQVLNEMNSAFQDNG